jgi:predicted nucleic acid-binding protein
VAFVSAAKDVPAKDRLSLIKPHKAGRLVNQIKLLAAEMDLLPRVQRSPDPTDDFLLALSEAGKADYLVTGDKSGLLTLHLHEATRIVSASEFAAKIA